MFLNGIQLIDFTKVDALYPLYALAIIFIATKGLGMLMRKLGLPQVVGMVIAGLLIGHAFFFGVDGFNGLVDIVAHPETATVLEAFASIGVVFILFSSGLETDVKQLKQSGVAATLIALAGVFVPIILGFVGTMFFMPGGIGSAEAWTKDYILNAIFVGTILAATSVGITVETLRELGYLNKKIGQVIVSAAIIDDVIGIIVLSIVTSLKGGADGNPVWWVVIQVILFFVCTIGVGIGLRFFFKWLIKKYPNKRRTSIFAIAMCLIYAFASEVLFGIASITGAYMAGIMLSGLHDGADKDATQIINKKVIMSGYLLFSPVFFANIGITADFSNFQPAILLLSLVFVALGIIGKIIGCGGVAKACKMSWKDSARVGCGMIARGEVALAVYGAGKAAGMIAEGGVDPMIPTVFLILISSILCPIFLKMLFKKNTPADTTAQEDGRETNYLGEHGLGEHGREDDSEKPERCDETFDAGDKPCDGEANALAAAVSSMTDARKSVSTEE